MNNVGISYLYPSCSELDPSCEYACSNVALVASSSNDFNSITIKGNPLIYTITSGILVFLPSLNLTWWQTWNTLFSGLLKSINLINGLTW
nr:hypothetical protein [Mycoplasmopsis arginini]